MTTKECEYIVVLAQERSITQAAQKLYITQPALSLFLTRLEERLGSPLFERGKDGFEPTFIGRRYLETARRMLELERNLQQDLCEINRQHMGIIRIGTSAHIGSYILPKVIVRFNEIYPNIELDITESNSGVLESMIAEKSIDVALMHLPLHSVNAPYERIFKDRYVMAFSKRNPLIEHIYDKDDKYPYIDPRNARKEKFILAFPYQRVRQISDRILTHAQIIPQIRLLSSSVQTALQYAGENLGVTFLPESYLSLFNYSDELQFCYMDEQYEAYWIFSLVYPGLDNVSVPIQEFTRIIHDTFGKSL